MRAEQVLHHQSSVLREGGVQLLKAGMESGTSDAVFPRNEKFGTGEGEIVIHHRIELVALQVRFLPFYGIDHLRNEVRIRIDGFYMPAPQLPERMPDAVRHIQPPSVYPVPGPVARRIHPAAGDVENILLRPTGEAGPGLLPLRQFVKPLPGAYPETARFIGPGFNGQPVAVGR